MSGLVFMKHDRVRVTDGDYQGETGTVAEDVPLSNSRALSYARVLLDGHDHGGAVYIPWRCLKLLPGPVDLASVRSGIEHVGDQLDGLVGKTYPDPCAVVHALDALRVVVKALIGEVEKLAQVGEQRD